MSRPRETEIGFLRRHRTALIVIAVLLALSVLPFVLFGLFGTGDSDIGTGPMASSGAFVD